MGVLYTAVALLSGGWFVVESHRLYAGAIRGEDLKPMRVFHASITYLTLVFVAVGLDPLLYLPIAF
jgi:protoheme IX farnesyltransferase